MLANIERLYNATVSNLTYAANVCIPRMKPDTLKHWWHSDLSALKLKAISSYTTWVDIGRPTSGPFYAEKK